MAPCGVLNVACGSGGPSIALAERTGCRIVGVDNEEAAIAQAERQVAERGLKDRLTFVRHDCSRRLPFNDGAFDIVVCIDSVLHLDDRFSALADWAGLLRPGGWLVFSDAAVLTGAVSKHELDVRASQGAFLLAPADLNEKAVEAAGLALERREDRTEAAADIARRWIPARERHADELVEQEGKERFAQRQHFLAVTAELAASRRLSRFLYVAQKPATPSA